MRNGPHFATGTHQIWIQQVIKILQKKTPDFQPELKLNELPVSDQWGSIIEETVTFFIKL